MSPRRPGLPVALALAFLAGAPAGCASLLDLDVTYADGGADSGGSSPDGSAGNDDSGTGALDATGTTDTSAPTDDASTVADATTPVDAGADAAIDAGPKPPIAYRQSRYNAVSSGATVDVQLDSPVLAGSAIVVCIEYTSDAPVTMTDTLGNQFTQATFVTAAHSGGYRGEIWYALHSPAGQDTVTVSVPSVTDLAYLGVYAHEYTNVGAFEAASSNFGPSNVTDMESGNITTTVPNELLFGFGITGTAMYGMDFNLRRDESQDMTEDRIVTDPATVQASGVGDGANAWSMLGAAFKPL